MEIINLTPHAINIVTENGTLTVEPSGSPARLSAKTVVTDKIVVGDIVVPVTTTRYGEIEGLPAKQKGVVYVVSSLVAQQAGGRSDVFVPNETIRDDKGRIIGCRSLGYV